MASILIIDDQPINLKVLVALLQLKGHKLRVAESGQKALKILQKQQPDIILLDVMMPDMDGFEVCRTIKKDESIAAIPIIFLTALTEVEDKLKGFEAGGVDFISKPFYEQEVLLRIDTHLTLRRQQQQIEQEKETLAYQQKIILLNNHIANIFLTSSKDSIYADVIDLIIEILESAFGYFGFINDAGELVCPSLTRTIWDQCQMPDKSIVFPQAVWRGVWGESLQQCKTIVANDGLQTPQGHVPLQNTIAVPILHQQQLIGQLVIANRKGGYGPKEQELLESAAGQIAPVLSAFLREEKQKQEHEQLEAQYRQAQKMEAIGTLAGGIAHDFNNILYAIIGCAELARDEIPAGCAADAELAEILRSGKRASDLVRQILTFSRKKELNREPLQPHLIVKEAMKLLGTITPSSIMIEEDIDPDSGTVLIDPTNIHQITMNLCTNALHAMKEEKGTLTVRLHRKEIGKKQLKGKSGLLPGFYVVLAVGDTGSGMDQPTRERIFEPYFTTKEVGGGTGLGLSVVHGIVEDCKGFLEVESTVGQGSTISVYLPVIDETASRLETDQQGRDPSTDVQARILVVDDEELIVRINKKRLEGCGHQVIAVSDSKKALDIFRDQSEKIDLLITDQTMPGLNGAELAKEILHIKPKIPVIMCTGHSEIVPEDKALRMGITKYVLKPLQKDELLDAVEEVLKGS